MGIGLGQLTEALFSTAARDMLAPIVEAGMTANITIYDPNTKGAGWTNVVNGLTVSPDTALVTCKARITPVSFSGPEGTSIQRIQFQIPWSATATALRVGMFVTVNSSPLNLTQLARSYAIVEILDSSNPIVNTFKAESSNAYKAV